MRLAAVVLLVLFLAPLSVRAEEYQRSDKGYEVSKDNYLNIPPDMKVNQVAHNVITHEPDVDYLARRLDEQNAKIQVLQSKINELETRLKTLETTPAASPSP
jgi:peptide subunit release factor 1 (eRF1)